MSMPKYKIGDKIKLKGKDYILNSPVRTVNKHWKEFIGNYGASCITIADLIFDKYNNPCTFLYYLGRTEHSWKPEKFAYVDEDWILDGLG